MIDDCCSELTCSIVARVIRNSRVQSDCTFTPRAGRTDPNGPQTFRCGNKLCFRNAVHLSEGDLSFGLGIAKKDDMGPQASFAATASSRQ
jgi:hypothetical protein